MGLFHIFIPTSQSWYISKKNLFTRGIVTIRIAFKTALKLAREGNLFFVKSHISLNIEGIKQTKVGNSLYNLVFFWHAFLLFESPSFLSVIYFSIFSFWDSTQPSLSLQRNSCLSKVWIAEGYCNQEKGSGGCAHHTLILIYNKPTHLE